MSFALQLPARTRNLRALDAELAFGGLKLVLMDGTSLERRNLRELCQLMFPQCFRFTIPANSLTFGSTELPIFFVAFVPSSHYFASPQLFHPFSFASEAAHFNRSQLLLSSGILLLLLILLPGFGLLTCVSTHLQEAVGTCER